MTRVAALYDIHGNLPALEVVIGEVRAANVRELVIGGDIFPGPMARECLALLRTLDLVVHYIRGNGDRNVLERATGANATGLPEAFVPLMDWHAERLEPAEIDEIRAWPLVLTLKLAGIGEVLFCHATPRDDNEMFNAATPDARLVPIFSDVAAPLVVCGHTHRQFDRSIGRVRVVNAGSVGMSFAGSDAEWLLLDGQVALRRTSYDHAAAAARIRATGYPRSDEFVENYLTPHRG
jgi:predicted phosphodiesterase